MSVNNFRYGETKQSNTSNTTNTASYHNLKIKDSCNHCGNSYWETSLDGKNVNYTKQRQKDDTNINAFKHGQIDKLPHCRCPAPCLNLRCARALVDGYFRPSICWACSVNNKPLRVKGNLVNVNLNSFAVDGLCTLCAWQKKYDVEKDAAIKETYNEVLRAISGLTTVDMTVPDTNSPEETMEPTVNTGMFKN